MMTGSSILLKRNTYILVCSASRTNAVVLLVQAEVLAIYAVDSFRII